MSKNFAKLVPGPAVAALLVIAVLSLAVITVAPVWSQSKPTPPASPAPVARPAPAAPAPTAAAAQPAGQPATPSNTLVTVNGIAVPEALLELNVRANVAQGQRDTPELRKLLTQELVTREVIAQEAVRLGLDKTPTAQAQFTQMRQGFLADLALADYQAKHPLTDAEIKAEYERQVAATHDAQQYKISLIVVPAEADAKALLARMKKGEPFDKLAREKSIDPSKTAGGVLDWVLPDQVVPAVSNVMVNLSKGQTVAAPIQTGAGWNIIRLDDKRPYKAPSLEESTNAVKAALLQRQRQEYAAKLRASAKITP